MKICKINNISKIDNSALKCEYPIMYPRVEYFTNAQSFLGIYENILKELFEKNFDIREYNGNLKDKNTVVYLLIERKFIIEEKPDTDENIYESELFLNEKEEKLFKVFYFKKEYFITDTIDKKKLVSTLYVNANRVKLYFVLNKCYVVDKINKKQYCIFFGE